MYAHKGVGGVAHSVAQLAANTSPAFRGVIFSYEGLPAMRIFSQAGLDQVVFPRRRSFWRHPVAYTRQIGSLRRALTKRQVDLVHAQALEGHRMVALAAGLARIPVITHVRGPVADYQRTLPRRIELHNSRLAVCVSEFVQRTVRQAFPSLPTHVVYNAIDFERLAPRRSSQEVRRELSIPHDAVIVGMVAHFAQPCKNHAGLLAAAEQLGSVANLHFVFVGEPAPGAEHFDAFLDRCNRSPVKQRVHLLGLRTDVADLFISMDIVVHPGIDEGFGRAVAEAMGLGRPVIAANSGAMPELIRHGRTGFLYTPGDTVGLVRHIRQLQMDAALRRRIGQAARRDTRSRFPIGTLVRDMENIYLDILQENRRAAHAPSGDA